MNDAPQDIHRGERDVRMQLGSPQLDNG